MTSEVESETTRLLELLAQAPLFAHLPQHSRDRLAGAARRRFYAAGESVIEHGAALADLYVVESGMLSASVPDRHGSPVEVARFGAGQYCGEMSLIRQDRADGSVTAITDAHVWLVPHAVIGEIAEREPTVMQELAAVVASRLSDTNRRVRELRPGRAVACISRDGGPWPRALVAQAAWSASMHLRQPALLLDLCPGPAFVPAYAHELPSAAELLERPELLAEHDHFASSGAPALGLVAAGGALPADPARLIGLLAEARSRYELVIVHLPAAASIDERAIDVDDWLLIWEEDQDPSGLEGTALRASEQTILLRRGLNPGLQGELRAFTSRGHGTALRAIPGGPEPLQGSRPEAVSDEPWSSVDWLARHLVRRKVGLALGGGGAKGYAHVGVLERLSEWGVPIDCVAGTSIGALLAAGVADGWTADALLEECDRLFPEAISPAFPWRSFMRNSKLRKGLERLANGKNFEDVVMPLAMVAADLYSREEVVFREGDAVQAMLASFAIPAVFPPVEVDGRKLVDGGLLNPVPIIPVAELGADIVIGVKLDNPVERPDSGSSRRWRPRVPIPPLVNTIFAMYEVMQWKISRESAAQADVTIQPVFRGRTGLDQFKRGAEFVAYGRAAAEEAHAELRELLPWID